MNNDPEKIQKIAELLKELSQQLADNSQIENNNKTNNKNVTIHLSEEYSNRLKALKLVMGEYYLKDTIETLIDNYINKQTDQEKQRIKRFENELRHN